MTTSGHALVLYDGVCGMCHALIQFLLKRDRRDAFRFAALQSEMAHEILKRHGIDASDLNTVFVVTGFNSPQEAVVSSSDAALAVARGLGAPWRWAQVFRVVPRFVRDAAYDFVARNRYGWFGKLDQCAVPRPEDRAKFL
jgi:predicted DCC family thiol-disulfide oxidoreductase YuxK